LRIAHYLDFPWSLLSGFLFLPPFLRDAAYDLLAANRYRWFGQLDACRVPTPEVRARFQE
jgi:predicted DCC family thiol-disulfide oxidoreductase YuxK